MNSLKIVNLLAALAGVIIRKETMNIIKRNKILFKYAKNLFLPKFYQIMLLWTKAWLIDQLLIYNPYIF